MVSEREQTAEKLSVEEQKIKEISKQYEKLKTLLDQKTQSRTRRLNTSTTLDTINNPNSGVRYRRRGETKNVLEFIHGGENGALKMEQWCVGLCVSRSIKGYDGKPHW